MSQQQDLDIRLSRSHAESVLAEYAELVADRDRLKKALERIADLDGDYEPFASAVGIAREALKK